MSDSEGKTIWRNGHGFRGDVEASVSHGRPVVVCIKCRTSAESPEATRPCIGHDVDVPPSGSGLHFDVTFTPKGRKPVTESVWLDIDGLGELLDFLRKFPADNRGHGFWHWRNADREFPCETCPSPLGDQARALERARSDAIDVDVAPPKLGPGPA